MRTNKKIDYYEDLGIDRRLTGRKLKDKLEDLRKKWIYRTNAPKLDIRQEAERKLLIIEEALKTLEDEINIEEAHAHQYDLSANRKDIKDLIARAWKHMKECDIENTTKLINEINLIDNSNKEAFLIILSLKRYYEAIEPLLFAKGKMRDEKYWEAMEYAVKAHRIALNLEENVKKLNIEGKNDLSLMGKLGERIKDIIEVQYDLITAQAFEAEQQYDMALIHLSYLIERHPTSRWYNSIAIANLRKIIDSNTEYRSYRISMSNAEMILNNLDDKGFISAGLLSDIVRESFTS